MDPFGQVSWKICLFEVDAAVLENAASIYLSFVLVYFLVPSPLFLLAGCLVMYPQEVMIVSNPEGNPPPRKSKKPPKS